VVGEVLVGLWLAVAAALVASGRRTGGAVRVRVRDLGASGLAVALLAAHLAVVDAVEDGSSVALLDAPMHSWFVAHRTGGLTVLMEAVSSAGGLVGMDVLAAVAAVMLLRRGLRGEAVVVVVAAAGAQGLADVFKLLYERARPPAADQLVVITSYALPSGHSLGSVVVLGVVAAVVVLLARGRAVRAGVVGVAAAAVLLIGVSRLYLGVHWPTDVASGYLLGGAWLALCVGALLVLRRRRAATAAIPEDPGPLPAAIGQAPPAGASSR
jgi:membrane-associated phospholipid phosphatase